MSNNTEALKAALIRSRDGYQSERATGLACLEAWREETLRLIDVALAALAQAEQAQPVAWIGSCAAWTRDIITQQRADVDRWVADAKSAGISFSVTPLYAAPPAAPQPQAAQQAVAPEGWREAVQRLVTGFEHVSGIARQWEPDYSSGADRAKWARATEACADVARMLAAAPTQAAPLVALTQAAQASDDAIWYDIRATLRAVIEDGHSADLDEVDAKRLLDLIDAAPPPAAPQTNREFNNEGDQIGGDDPSYRGRTAHELEHFSHWIATAMPFDKRAGMAEHKAKTDAALQGWMARAASQDFAECLAASEKAAAPQPLAPLTEEEIAAIPCADGDGSDWDALVRFARAIERAHGIKDPAAKGGE